MFKLICGRDSVALGIQREDGAWDMAVFEKHLKECPECWQLSNCFRSQLSEAFGEMLDAADGFLKKKKSIGDLRAVVKKYRKEEEKS